MASNLEVKSIVQKGRGWLLAWASALFLLVSSPLVAYADYGTPQGWNVDIVSYTRGPNYVIMTVKPPAGTVEIKSYEYEHSTDTSAYNVQTNGSVASPIVLDSSGDYTFDLYNMQGGGYPTYLRFTAVDASGTETPTSLGSMAMFVLQLDVAVYLDGVSPSVLQELQDALDNLKSSTGVDQVAQAGSDLQSALDNVSGYSAPGSGDLAFTIPLYPAETVGNQSFSAGTVTIFTSDQLAKYSWLSTMRTVLRALMWVTFVVFLIVRFSPFFKV